MTSSSLIFRSFYILIFLRFSGAHGVNIGLYMHKNFTGLFWQSNSTAACNNIITGFAKKIYVKSIRTDTCFIAYWGKNCRPSTSTKFLPGAYPNINWWTESFHICNEEEGGGQLNIDIANHNYPDHSSVPHVVFESYRNVCSCINVPKYVQNGKTWAIENHHNSLIAYFEPDCSEIIWYPMPIRAGHWSYHHLMHEEKRINYVTNTTYKIQSFGPDPKALYFQQSCKPNKTTTNVLKTYESTTQSTKHVSFQISKEFEAGASTSTTTTSTDDFERTTERLKEVEVDANGNEQIQVLTSKIVKLEAQIESFEARIFQQQKDFLNMFTERITELQQGFRNFTEKIKFDLHEMCG